MTTPCIKQELRQDLRLLRLTLARPKANIVDAAMIQALHATLDAHRDRIDLAAVLVNAEGPNFSFGASVAEHLPDSCAAMLRDLHRLLLSIIEYPVPVLCAIRGFCLGGGLELASACSRIFAAPGASFAQPEIQLGVFAPAASCLLPERIGQNRADDLLFSGRTLDSDEALAIGLIDQIDDDPDAAALAYVEHYLAPRSSAALRCAVRAAHTPYAKRIRQRFAEVEALYLHELMQTADAIEGLNSFLHKRQPVWTHR
ncbi:MAG: cyclohexa-1,5-dienecarbonyl-CoA hydratase [Gammaproteobacteria bacterium]|nr:cyclohexa-1,5-dienecarbonyl-CoA hydratase [Gammaproteobacteria bacterium]